MSQGITIELHFFIISILWGALILLAYDQLRVLRRVLRHKASVVTVEDLFFWLIASVFIFAMIYVQNSGTIRGFSVMGMVIGMVVYHYIFSDWLVKLESRGILLLLRPFSLAIKYVCKVIGFLMSKGKKISVSIYGQLKKRLKSVKISLDKRREKRVVRKKHRKENKKNKKKNNKKNKKNKKKNNEKINKKSNKKNNKEK